MRGAPRCRRRPAGPRLAGSERRARRRGPFPRALPGPLPRARMRLPTPELTSLLCFILFSSHLAMSRRSPATLSATPPMGRGQD